MKNVMEWMKQHWFPVLMGAIGILGFAGGVYLSLSWSESLSTDLQAKVSGDVSALAPRAAQVTYKIDPVGSGDKEVTVDAVPTPAMTEFFKAERAKKAAAAHEVVSALVKFNQGGRTDDQKMFLVQGLFPKPPERETFRLTKEMARIISQEAPARLLSIVRAGTPPTSDEVRQALSDRKAEEVMSRVTPGGGEKDLSPEQMADITRSLTSLRVRKYQERAERIGLYAEPAAIVLGSLPANPQAVPSVAQCWDWQTAYWAAEDVLRGIARANEAGADRGVPGAVVKHIESLRVLGLAGMPTGPSAGPGGLGGPGGGNPMGAPTTGTAGDVNAAPTNPAVSITGRQSGPGTGNGLYDVRNVDLVAIVSFRELPKLLNALSATNLMSVLEVDLEGIDPLVPLNAGFFYGPEHVVRAHLVIETLWLREWTTPKMPKEVRDSLGVPDAATPPA